jgi:hypothetical protein
MLLTAQSNMLLFLFVAFGTLCVAQTDYSALEAACIDDIKLTKCKEMEAASIRCNSIDPNDQASLVSCVCVQSMFSLYIE